MQGPVFLAPGTLFAGDFRVIRPLGQGGMGAVYVVEQVSTGKQRALKLMLPQLGADPELRRRFEQEARIGARIASDHVVEVQAAGIDVATEAPYLVMELLEGEDLAARVERRGALSVEELRAVFAELCHAVAAAHAAGIVHRDLKPENVFLAASRRAGGAAFTVKVLDFGIAKLASAATAGRATRAMGSPMWMAPEQTEDGAVTPSADVWALGLIAFHLLTGRYFWKAAGADATMAQLFREIVLEPIPPAEARAADLGCADRLPRGFGEWFARCVTRDVGQRFTDAGAAWAALDRALAPYAATMAPAVSAPPPAASAVRQATPAPISSTVGTAAPSPRRRVLPLGLAAFVAFVGASGLALLVHKAQEKRRVAALAGSSLAMSEPPPMPSFASPDLASPPAPPSAAPPPPPSVPPSSAPLASADAPPASATMHAKMLAAPTPPANTTKQGAPPSASPPPLPEPEEPATPVMNSHLTTVAGHKVRLIGRIVKNDSNVSDPVVRKAVEWDAWQYLRCYDSSYAARPTLQSGNVNIGFEILDQLPRFARVNYSEFAETRFNECLVGVLSSQTINAAGPEGRGKIIFGFRFVVMN